MALTVWCTDFIKVLSPASRAQEKIGTVIRGWRATRLPPAILCHRYAVKSVAARLPPAILCHRYAVKSQAASLPGLFSVTTKR